RWWLSTLRRFREGFARQRIFRPRGFLPPGTQGLRVLFRWRLPPRRFYNRARPTRLDPPGFEAFVIEIPGNWEPIANLIPPNRRSRVRIFRPGNFTVVKTLVLQRLLNVLDHLIRLRRARDCGEQNQTYDRKFHVDATLTPKCAPYSEPGPETARVSCRSFNTSR